MASVTQRSKKSILVVDVHIQRLRKKIEPEIEKPEYNVTVAGVGYKFQAA